MANQMIALGVRGPQIPDLGATSARMSNIMAYTAVAREKQAGIARANAFRQLVSSPEFDAANPEHIKAAQALDPEGAAQIAGAFDKRNIDRVKYVNDFFETSLFVLSKAQNPQQLALAAGVLDKNFPDFKEVVGRTVEDIVSDPEGFDAGRNKALFRAQKAAEQIPYIMPKAKAELATSETGVPLIATYGGLTTPSLKQPRSLIPRAPRAGTVEVGEQTTVEPGVGGPEAAPMAAPESVAPMMPGAKSPRLSASMASSLLGLRNNADYQVALQAIKRADPAAAEELRRIMPVFDPALSDAIREAATAEFEVIPQGGQPGLVTGERGGVGGPDEDYVEAPAPFRLKNPSVAPYPGSAQVPLPRLADEKRVEAQATKDVELAAERAKSKADQQRAARNFLKVSGVDLRTGKDPVADLIRRSTSGTVEALGAEFMGALPEQIGGGATPGAEAIGELEAIAATITNTLLGGKLGTGISNEDRKMIERMVGDIQNPYIPAGKRLAAWNRVKQIQMSYLDEKPSAAPAGPRRTPVTPNIPRAAIDHLRKNPSLSAAFDAKYGKGQAAKVLGRR